MFLVVCGRGSGSISKRGCQVAGGRADPEGEGAINHSEGTPCERALLRQTDAASARTSVEKTLRPRGERDFLSKGPKWNNQRNMPLPVILPLDARPYITSVTYCILISALMLLANNRITSFNSPHSYTREEQIYVDLGFRDNCQSFKSYPFLPSLLQPSRCMFCYLLSLTTRV